MLRCSAFFAAFLLAALAASAQPVPKITAITPEWIQRGTTIDVVLTGENLGAVNGFVFNDAAGLSASNVPPLAAAKPVVSIEAAGITRAEPAAPRDDKRLVIRVSAAAEAPLGARELRVLSPTGVSNPIQFNVGQWPEVAEQGPNNSAEQAQPITFPAAINGAVSAAAQVDYYRFQAAKGQEIVFEVDASRRGSALDSSLAILDAAGQELARSEDALGLDSLLAFTVPSDGEYLAQVRDFRFQGGATFKYRLYAGALPYLDYIFPFGGQRGKQVEVALTGRNLEGTAKMTFDIAVTAPLGRQEIRARTPKGYSNPVAFDTQDFPDVFETEPNDATDKANSVTVPVVINGRMGAAKDIDHFKFKSAKDQKLVCEVAASRFGSPLDAHLILKDAAGAILQQNDDDSGADARLEFDAKKDAEYVVALRDLTGRGGESFCYRLAIRPPGGAAEAGFVARFLPDTLRVARGGTSRLRCEVTRSGFDGPVRFAFQDLPPGVYAEPFTLTGAPSSGLMILTALPDAPLGNFPVKLVASAVIAGKTVTRPAAPLLGDKVARDAFLTVLDAPPFTLEPITLTAALEQNQSATVEVLAQRREGFTGDIKLSAEGFSAGRDSITKSLDVGEVTLKAAESSGKLTLKARLDSEIGTRTIVIKGETAMGGANVVEFSRPIPVTVSQVPFVISSTLSRLSVTALPPGATSAAGETSTTIKVERRDGFAGEVALTLEGVPAGIETVLEKIPANAGETILKLTATPKTAIGTNFSFTVLGTGMHKDRNFKHRTGPIALIVSAPEMVEPSAKTSAATAASGDAK